ncbi:MAG: TonB-dependent receptor [Haliea sp.]|uniref:TonB-dependent receptor n=1 Tax=Haliea sp. TaxID=1932666 RepID=UPI0032EC8E75
MNKRNNNHKHSLSLVLASCYLAAAPSLAQQDTGVRTQALEEVVVTAQKREESLQETPIAVSAFDIGALQQLGVGEPGDVALYTPNLEIRKPPGSSDNYGYSMRGMSSTDPSLLTEPTVGLYADGVYIARISGASFDTVDLERIEVLRGPQGTLYGRNAIGGAINLVTRKPGEEFGFRQKLSAGNYDYLRSETSVDTGMYNGFAATLSYTHWKREGWLDNAEADNKLGETKNSDALRFALRWSPNDALTADYVFDYSDRDSNGAIVQLVHIRPFQQGLGGPIYAQAAAVASPNRQDSLPMPFSDSAANYSTIKGHALTVEWAGDNFTLKSITAHRDWDSGTTENEYGSFRSDGVNVLNGIGGVIPAGEFVPLFLASRESRQDQFTQEFQMLGTALNDRLQYTLGLYYFEEETYEDNPQSFVLPAIFAYGGLDQGTQSFLCQDPTFSNPLACFGKDTLLSTPVFIYGSDNDSVAAYSQLTYAATDEVDVTLGLRYTRDQKTSFLRNSTIQRNEGIEEVIGDDSWSNVTPALTVSYAPTDTLNTYFTLARGFRSGGFNARAASARAFSTPFNEENVTSYELGIKSDLWEQKLRVNAALFHYVYEDKQVTQFEAGSSGASSIIANAGKTEAQGVELEVTLIPVTGLLLKASYGFIDNNIKEFDTTPSNPVTGVGGGTENVDISDIAKTIHTPRHNASLIAEYTFEPFSFGQLVLQADSSYNSERYFHPINNLYDSAGKQTLINARASLTNIDVGSGSLRISAWGKNLADKEYREWGIDFGALGFATDSFILPRMYGLDVIYEY